MKEKREKILKEEHPKYDKFELKQLIIDLDKGEYVMIQVLDSNKELVNETEYKAKYDNSHINLQIQCKENRGIRR